jgi:hypothetical protein
MTLIVKYPCEIVPEEFTLFEFPKSMLITLTNKGVPQRFHFSCAVPEKTNRRIFDEMISVTEWDSIHINALDTSKTAWWKNTRFFLSVIEKNSSSMINATAIATDGSTMFNSIRQALELNQKTYEMKCLSLELKETMTGFF